MRYACAICTGFRLNDIKDFQVLTVDLLDACAAVQVEEGVLRPIEHDVEEVVEIGLVKQLVGMIPAKCNSRRECVQLKLWISASRQTDVTYEISRRISEES